MAIAATPSARQPAAPLRESLLVAVEAGIRPPFPFVLHVHAVLMGSFLVLLLAQATLAATGRQTYHQQPGLAAFALTPALVIAGLILVPTMYHQFLSVAQSAPAEFQAQIERGLHKRMMFLATAVALPAAFTRIKWLPQTFPESPLSAHLYMLVAASPMIV